MSACEDSSGDRLSIVEDNRVELIISTAFSIGSWQFQKNRHRLTWCVNSSGHRERRNDFLNIAHADSFASVEGAYLNARAAIIEGHLVRGTDMFWVDWVCTLMPQIPTGEAMCRLDRYAEIVCHSIDFCENDLRDLISRYFKISLGVRWPIGCIEAEDRRFHF